MHFHLSFRSWTTDITWSVFFIRHLLYEGDDDGGGSDDGDEVFYKFSHVGIR